MKNQKAPHTHTAANACVYVRVSAPCNIIILHIISRTMNEKKRVLYIQPSRTAAYQFKYYITYSYKRHVPFATQKYTHTHTVTQLKNHTQRQHFSLYLRNDLSFLARNTRAYKHTLKHKAYRLRSAHATSTSGKQGRQSGANKSNTSIPPSIALHKYTSKSVADAHNER